MPEQARLIAGLYDAQTFERVLVVPGQDYVVLATVP
jgi:hypothetical protein